MFSSSVIATGTATGAGVSVSVGAVSCVGVVIGAVELGKASLRTLKGTRPLTTWPSTPMSRQRAVISPDKLAGRSNTISLSVAPCRGGAKALRTPSAVTTSPEAEPTGTDLANVTVHVAGAVVRTSPSRGMLLSYELCACATCGVPAKNKNTAPVIARRRRMWRIWAFDLVIMWFACSCTTTTCRSKTLPACRLEK